MNKGLYEQAEDSGFYTYRKVSVEEVREAFEAIFYSRRNKINPNSGIDFSNWLSKEIAGKLEVELPSPIEKIGYEEIYSGYTRDEEIVATYRSTPGRTIVGTTKESLVVQTKPAQTEYNIAMNKLSELICTNAGNNKSCE